MEKQPTACQMEESLDDDPPPQPPEAKMESRELAGLETSSGDAWELLAKRSHCDHVRKDMLAGSAQLALEDAEFDDIFPIYGVAAISDDHADRIDDPKIFKPATESPLTQIWDMAMNEELDAIGQHQVFEDFVELLERRKAMPSHGVYKIKHNAAGNVQRFNASLVCVGNHQIESIDYQAVCAATARLGDIELALAIAAKYALKIHHMDGCTAFLGVHLEDEIYMHPPQG